MHFIKAGLFLFSLLFITSSSSHSKIIFEEGIIIEDFYLKNESLMYTKNFKEYKKNLSITILNLRLKNI
jgi:hypothetical protein